MSAFLTPSCTMGRILTSAGHLLHTKTNQRGRDSFDDDLYLFKFTIGKQHGFSEGLIPRLAQVQNSHHDCGLFLSFPMTIQSLNAHVHGFPNCRRSCCSNQSLWKMIRPGQWVRQGPTERAGSAARTVKAEGTGR
jgi:hypothetical protein